MRAVTRAVAVTLVGVVACVEVPSGPAGPGSLSISMASGITLDSGHVVIDGLTKKTVTVTPGTTKVIDSILAGSYTVALEGFKGGGVGYYQQLTGVNVVAGQTTTVTPGTYVAMQPTILSIPTYTATGQFAFTFSKVSAAGSYVVQRDTLANFSTSKDTAIAAVDTSLTVSLPTATGPYNVRVLAVDPYLARGMPSLAATITTVTGVAVSPTTATIAPAATQQFTAAATDAKGNAVTGVTFFWASSNHNIATIDSTGLATGVAGGTVAISALGLGIPGNAHLTVTGGVPTKLAITVQPTSTTAGAAVSPAVEVEVRDVNGLRVTTARNTVSLTIATGPAGATLLGTATINAVAGVASFSGINIQKAGTGYTLSAASTGLTGAASTAFAISAAAPAQLAVTGQPSNTEGNVAISPALTVTILDAFGNVATTATNSVTMALGANPWAGQLSLGGSLSGTKTVAAVNGVATFSALSVDKPASGYTLVASSGALGTATTNPFRIFLTMQSVVPGHPDGYHTCGIAAGGTYCWGYNYNGQLGGPTVLSTSGTQNPDNVAVLVRGGLTFTQVAPGGSHTCAITAAGAAYCWGYNGNGQLGDGTQTQRLTPVAVAAPAGIIFSQIDAADYHSCARATTGDIYCWGANFNGQLGDNTTTQRLTPVKVLPASPVSFTQVSTGSAHTCALDVTPIAYCWGYNGSGQLGDSTFTQRLIPTAVWRGLRFATISAGASHTCAVTTSAVMSNGFCWGYDGSGELGDGSTLSRDSVPATVAGGLLFTNISVGGFSCSVAGGAGNCWGYNGNGQLGDGTLITRRAPVAVSGGFTFTTVKASGSHGCGLVGTNAYCWGGNFFGQLGNGTFAQTPVPQQIVQ